MHLYLRLAMLVQILNSSFRFVAKFEDDCRFSMVKKDKIKNLIEQYKRDHLSSFTTVTKPIAFQTINILEYFTKSKFLMAGYKVSNVQASLLNILDELIQKPVCENIENLKSNIEPVQRKNDVKSVIVKFVLLNEKKWLVLLLKN